MALYLGLDVGTTKVAATIVDAATGAQLAVESAPQPDPFPAPAGRSEWDARAIRDQALAVGRAALAASGRAGEIAAIGVTGQQHGGLIVSTALGDDLRPLTPLIGWQDKRADEPNADGVSTLAALHARLAGLDTRDTGCTIASGFLGTTLFWLAGRDELPTRDARATFVPDYLVASLCDTLPATDPTDAGGAGLFDAAHGRWHAEMLAALDLPAALLPPVEPTGTLRGTLGAAGAAALGLREGVPVMNALGDNQASFFGSVGAATDALLVNVGTGGQVSAIAPRFARGALLETRPYLDGGFLLVGAGIVGGKSYALLRDFFRQVGRDLFGVEPPHDLYPAINALAAAVPPGSDGLRCDPRFGGNRYDPDQRGAFVGIDARNLTPGHLARALLEGVAQTFHDLYGTMQGAGVVPRTRLIGSGNGLRQNPLLTAIIAERFGLPLLRPAHREEAAFGAALLAATATGELTLSEATSRLRYEPA
jgi:sugar (pentulose or hexulose) kinase